MSRDKQVAACTCARLSGDPGSYPCPVHPEFGAATFAGTVVQSDSAAYTDPAMWKQVRLPSGAYVWVFLCASDEKEPWNLGR